MNGNGHNAEAIIAKFIALRDKIEAIHEAANAEMKPYDDAMKTLSAWLSAEMERTGATSIKTESGTAYRTTLTSMKIVDREKFIALIETGHWELVNLSASKGDVKAYIEEHRGELPPGLEISSMHEVRVRRP